MFNGSREGSVEEADCAASVGHAVKWDRGGSQDGGGGQMWYGVQDSEKVYELTKMYVSRKPLPKTTLLQ